ncbi:hypothetical protein [uncultured Polaribacter sp.]|uniref:hypothetical protein n=1 Tax=uncultured Polaribacter sp. TaxID=174711 RepID=UPI0026076CA0|nr:hypothetical protein [uncultured Polaribacter sp.]
MNFKSFLFYSILLFTIISCSEDNDITVARNLQEYMDENSDKEKDVVIACAANAEANIELNYIFYYPEEGATDIRYYETEDTSVDPTDYTNYRRQSLTSEAIFGGKLERFSRSGATESWCLVTYIKDGKFHISDPIRLKNNTKATEYSNEVAINYKTTLEPNFSWEDGTVKENVIYFQVISDEEGDFISGTYTENTFFQYYDETNVTLTINTTTPVDLVEDEIYNFTMMGVSEDNWVNLIIEEQFIPRNLEEYIATNTEKTIDTLFAFAGSANGNEEVTYIYFDPIEGAFNYRYYETEDTTVDKTDFANYKRRNLTETAVFGGEFRRFTKNSSDEVWCLVTYITEGKLHISEPIKTQNNSRETEWTTDVAIDISETLKPRFTWTDGTYDDTETYFQVFTQIDDTFITGTFTTEKTFQYYDESNITGKIHSDTPPALVLDDEYKFSLFGISPDNWINLVIQTTFIAE